MSRTPISDKAAFDAYPYAIGGRVIAAKVVMFSVAEKLELELAELRAGRDFWRNKCEKIESDQTILNIATLAENAELRQQVEKMKCCENCKSFDWNANGYNACENAYKKGLSDSRCDKWVLNDAA